MKMKPLCILLCFTMIGIGPTLLWASSPGNPLVNVGQGRLRISAEWEQQNRSLELDADADVISNRYWLKGSYGLYDWLDMFGCVGMVDFNVSTTQGSRSYSYESRHLTFGFSGGLKMRAFHDENRNLSGTLTLSGSHLRNDSFVGSKSPSEMIWNELQLAGSLGKTFGFAFPYLGLAYSLVDGDMDWEGGVSQGFRDPGGLAFAGVDFSLPSFYMLSVEVGGRVGGNYDEIIFSFGLSQRSK